MYCDAEVKCADVCCLQQGIPHVLSADCCCCFLLTYCLSVVHKRLAKCGPEDIASQITVDELLLVE